MKTHEEIWESSLSIIFFSFFLYVCLHVCLCVCIGFSVHNWLLATVLELRPRLYPYYQHLLGLFWYEKALNNHHSTLQSLPVQPHGQAQMWRKSALSWTSLYHRRCSPPQTAENYFLTVDVAPPRDAVLNHSHGRSSLQWQFFREKRSLPCLGCFLVFFFAKICKILNEERRGKE